MILYPVPMRRVTIDLLEPDLPLAALELARTEAFSPDPLIGAESELTKVPGEAFRALYRQAETRLEKILEHLPDLGAGAPAGESVLGMDELGELNERLGELWQHCSQRQEVLRALDEEQAEVGHLQDTLDMFANIGVDLRVLDRDRLFMDLRVGTLSRFNLDRMQDALGLAGFVVHPFLRREDTAHVIVAGPRGEAGPRVEAVLESAGFRDLPVPEELRGDPERVKRVLLNRRLRIEQDREVQRREIRACAETNREFLQRALAVLALAQPFVELETAARQSSHLVVVGGWAPARAIADIEQRLKARLAFPFLLRSRPPSGAEFGRVPTLLSEHRWLAPFASLVRQYGVPGYGEIDPTLIFAVTFVAMFGMMFGDVGHGAVIAVMALIYRRRLGHFSVFGVAAGLSSMLFGAVYGSVFGFEEWLHPLWVSPMSDPVLLLKVAFAWGVGFLVLMTLLYVHNRLRVGDLAGALLDTHGANNLLLYGGLLWLVASLATGGEVSALQVLLPLVSLLVLAAYKWRHSKAPVSERVMVVAVECFEAVMGNVSGTLSFLRVAAFSINHVALAVAVFTLAELMGPTGHWLTIIGGNLFILVLEGAIVAIQALRLEYYEGFSRFFTGDGKAFRPLRLAPVAGESGPVSQSAGTTAPRGGPVAN